LALTPGTLPVHVTREPPVIYIHVLHLHDIEAVRRDVQHLADLAVRAFGPPAAVAALAERVGPGR
jgi:multisubunit Na+/H+ antiporter MnhE subunit